MNSDRSEHIMKSTWKYVEQVDNASLEKVEQYFSVKLPNDYMKLIHECNQGKPLKCRFSIQGRAECIIDYMVDLKKVIAISCEVKTPEIIPIATDPFGNLIGYRVVRNGPVNSVKGIVFWDHETRKETFVVDTFSEFLSMLQ